MLAVLLLQAAVPQTAVDAERAFSAAARAEGQWTAFRKFAAEDGVMFVPEPVKAQDWLRDREDPPKSIEWWPAESYVSCDGSMAVNTGGWKRPDGSVGYFTTVWKRQADGGWKWAMDHGDSLSQPRSEPVEARIRRASCKTPTRGDPRAPIPVRPTGRQSEGASSDHTLIWEWQVDMGGGRRFAAHVWNGSGFDRVIEDKVAAPK